MLEQDKACLATEVGVSVRTVDRWLRGTVAESTHYALDAGSLRLAKVAPPQMAKRFRDAVEKARNAARKRKEQA